MLESAQKFGKYTLMERLAVGGMAEIFRAKAQGVGGFEKVLAIKRLHDHFGVDDEFARMLVDEAKLAVHLAHPNIAQIFDLGCIDERYFIAMEFIDGTDLHRASRALRERRRLVPAPVAVFAIAEALAGLHYAHTRRGKQGDPLEIVHRDVSPQNIMVSRAGDVKVVDFGIAKAEKRLQEDTQNGIIKGKFFYMAPEQAYGHHVDARTDVFAAGMSLYELLIGRNPYEGLTDHQMLDAVRRVNVQPISAMGQVDSELERIVMTAIRRDPNARFRDARQFNLALMDYLARHHAGFGRLHVADFISGLPREAFSDQAEETRSQARLSRDDFRPSEASMIFEAGNSIEFQREGYFTGDDEPNPFADDEPTELWEPGHRQDGAATAGTFPAAPTDMNIFGGSDSRGESPIRVGARSQRGRAQTVSASRDTSVKDSFLRRRVVWAAAAASVVVMSLAAVWVVSSGDDSTKPASTDDSIGAEPTASSPSDSNSFVELRVESEPPGARVLLAGVEQGSTPMTLTDLILQERYQLTLLKEGFEPAEEEIVAVDGRGPWRFELAPDAGRGVLTIRTLPANATIEVDGSSVGTSPLTLDGLRTDESLKITAKLDGRDPVSETFSWAPGQSMASVDLEFPDRQLRDPNPRAKSPSRRPSARRTSSRRAATSTTASARPRSSTDTSLDLWGAAEEEDSAASKPPPKSRSAQGLDIWGGGGSEGDASTHGFLSVQVKRGWGRVFVDDRQVSSETPLVKHKLKPGTYRVKVYFPTLKRYSAERRITIGGDKTTTEIFVP